MNTHMVAWYLPRQPRILLRRWISIRSFVLVLMIIAFLLTEFRFNWIEILTGRYLVTTNAARPESGTIWDQGQQSELARETLADFMNRRQSAQREARLAATLGQVVDSLDNGGGAMISADHFVELYLKLPPVLSNELVSPFAMLSQMSSGKWQRVYFDRQADQLLLFFLDAENQVLHRISIGSSLLAHIKRGEVAVNGRLDQLSDLAANIYPADRFFSVLDTFPPEVQNGIVAHPEDLLRVSGNLVRVGIAADSFFDTVDLGFEVDSAQGPKVILMQGQRDAVRQIQRVLNGGSPYQRPFFRWPGTQGTSR